MQIGDQTICCLCPKHSTWTRGFLRTRKWVCRPLGCRGKDSKYNVNILLLRYIHGTLFTPWSLVSQTFLFALWKTLFISPISPPNCVSVVCMLMWGGSFCCVKRNEKRLPMMKKRKTMLVTEEQRAREGRQQKLCKWKSKCWESISVWDALRVKLNIGFVSLFAGFILGTSLSRLEERRTETHVSDKTHKKWWQDLSFLNICLNIWVTPAAPLIYKNETKEEEMPQTGCSSWIRKYKWINDWTRIKRWRKVC